MNEHAARPLAMHDTTELRKLQRAERRAFVLVLAACGAVLVGMAHLAGAL